MGRRVRSTIVILTLALIVASQVMPSVSQAGSAQADQGNDVPAGFIDGIPVGSDGGPDAPTGPGEDPQFDASGSATRAVPQRYFGREPWAAIRLSASQSPRTCTVSDEGLTAMAVAPVFKESSAASSATTTPSPMTLSRYDEWNGTYATTSNQSANYGLYAFRDPNSAYERAFWHSGIGIWQYDSAGVGAPFTAIERMDVSVVSRDVTKTMAARYCNPSASLIGHGEPYTGLERRFAAWSPWGYPCTLCEEEFQAMTSTTPDFTSITLVDGISTTGGVEERTCTLTGVVGTVRCWYVDASVGTIEGATGWATIAPLDGGGPTVAPTPLAEPFYVVDRGATEERHWLRADTGYDIDISGSRQIGTNERPRSTQAGSGITWRSNSGLCDLSTGRGACVPPAPIGLTLATTAVSGTFRPIALDAQGDGRGDLLWYAPGSSGDYLWSGQGSGGFTAAPLNIGGTYDDVLPLDVDADGDDDIVWYQRATGGSYLWLADGNGTWQARKLSRPKGLRPIVVDTDGNGRDEVFWYGPGSLADSLWAWNGSSFTSQAQSVGGAYQPLTGDFDGNRKEDILWYGPGSASDRLRLSTGAGTYADVAISVGGSYLPLIGDFDGDRNDDVFWYGMGSAPDNIWFGGPGGAFTRQTAAVRGSYQPQVGDLGGDGRDDIVWYAKGSASDGWWRWAGDRSVTSTSVVANGTHQALVGGFSTGGSDGIFWYAPGATPDGVWWR